MKKKSYKKKNCQDRSKYNKDVHIRKNQFSPKLAMLYQLILLHLISSNSTPNLGTGCNPNPKLMGKKKCCNLTLCLIFFKDY